MDISSIVFKIKVCCVFSLESPHRSDCYVYSQYTICVCSHYEYIQYTIFNIKKKITLNYPKSAAIGFFSQATQEGVRNSRGKRAISVLLYLSAVIKF